MALRIQGLRMALASEGAAWWPGEEACFAVTDGLVRPPPGT